VKRTATATLFIAAMAAAQSARPHFEVCDIKENKSDDVNISANFAKGGRVDVHNIPMHAMIAAIYKVPMDMVSGPAWINSARFDMVAKAAPTSTEDDLFEMTKTMLVERFKMVMHLEKKTVPVYALVVGKKGPAMTPTNAASTFGCDGAPAQPNDPPGMVHRACHAITMSDFVRELPGMAPAYIQTTPVVDLTSLEGKFDFKVDWMGKAAYNAALASGAGEAISIFDAIEKLGLKLDSRKHPVDAIVIDSMERAPTDN
jgi:uncharacterized protein (TIGR03435 family)